MSQARLLYGVLSIKCISIKKRYSILTSSKILSFEMNNVLASKMMDSKCYHEITYTWNTKSLRGKTLFSSVLLLNGISRTVPLVVVLDKNN